MKNLIAIAQIITVSLLTIFILLQKKESGLGSAFGGSGGYYGTRRGIEKKIFWGTWILGFLLIGLSLANLLH